MASTILADNGVSSGSAGIKTTADSTGALALQTTTAGGAATTAVTIDTSQNVGIGTSSPGDRVVVSSTSSGSVVTLARLLNAGTATGTASRLLFTNNTDGSGGAVSAAISHIAENTSGAGALAFYTPTTGSPVERARIDSSGNLLVGTTSSSSVSNGGLLVLTGTATGGYIGHQSGTSSGAVYLRFDYAGAGVGSITQSGTTAVAYNTTSDYRLKENVQPISGALGRVAALKPCTYTWKSAPDEIGEGFIAHELQEVCPQAVTGEKDAVNEDGSINPQSIDTSFLVATLTAAIQEQQALITTLTERITALEAK
jgi:hypothetical protein